MAERIHEASCDPRHSQNDWIQTSAEKRKLEMNQALDRARQPSGGLERDQSTAPKISVVIPAYKGRHTIEECLQSVLNAAQRINHEIIVVESSGDGADALIRGGFPQVQVITSDKRLTAGEARNVGIRHGKGEYVFCVDQDCLVPPDWIEQHLHHLQQPGVGAVGGSIAVANPWNISGWCVYFLEFLHHFPARSPKIEDQQHRRNFLIGANSAWPAAVFARVKFPDQTLGEDLLISQAVRESGFAVVYDPTITVYHYNRSGWREFLRYCRAMGQAAATDQARIGGIAIAWIQRLPLLIYGAPLLVIPLIAWKLLKAPPGYLARYIVLLPCCIIGQLIWADAFRWKLKNNSNVGFEHAECSRRAGVG